MSQITSIVTARYTVYQISAVGVIHRYSDVLGRKGKSISRNLIRKMMIIMIGNNVFVKNMNNTITQWSLYTRFHKTEEVTKSI